MSLCVCLRSPAGEVLMAADSALSISLDDRSCRISNYEDLEKVIEYQGNFIFCSGLYDACQKIREYIRSMACFEIGMLQKFAQDLYTSMGYPGVDYVDTVIMICRTDSSLTTMRLRDSFAVEWDPPKSGLGIAVTTLGAHAETAYHNAIRFAENTQCGMPLIEKVFASVNDEEVGGHCITYHKGADGAITKRVGTFTEKGIRKVTVPGYYCSTVFATDGRFNGVVQAKDFLLKNGDSMVSALNSKGQIKGDFIDIRGANIVNKNGDRVLYIDETGIHWDSKFSPFKYQYAASINGPWHNEPATNDEYRRESTDGGTTWGPAIKYIAKDGKDGRDGSDGSDASVNYANIKAALEKASSIPSAFMSVNEMGAPEIYGGKIYGAEIYAGGVGEKGGRIIALTDSGISIWNGNGNRVLTIHEDSGDAYLTTSYNWLRISAPHIDFPGTESMDFTGVKTTGLHATFA